MSRQFNNQTPPKNNQDVFDRACERLLTHFDWGRSIAVPDAPCSYRIARHDKEGVAQVTNCCVVGYMIPDWPEIMPTGSLRMTGVPTLFERLDKARAWFQNVDTFLLNDLQTLHDSASSWLSQRHMLASLQSLAMRYCDTVTMNPKFLEVEDDTKV